MSKATFYGMNPPFIGGPQNVMSRQEDDRLLKNDILQLLTTVPGERVMRPDFGIPLRTFIFEQNVATDVVALESKIRQELARQEPRVTVENVKIISDQDRNGMQVTILVRLVKDPRKTLTIEHFLAQGA